MKNSVVALAFVAAAVGSLPAFAQDPPALARLDTDKSGDVSLEEFVAAGNPRVSSADKDGDGKATAEEIAATFNGGDAAQRAAELVKRFDTDGDGVISLAEVEARRKARFAEVDANSDGKLTAEELKAGQ
jgi:Ca2+-binding EF-hand superfamily protein